jgi:hypothetical protein
MPCNVCIGDPTNNTDHAPDCPTQREDDQIAACHAAQREAAARFKTAIGTLLGDGVPQKRRSLCGALRRRRGHQDSGRYPDVPFGVRGL